MDNHEKLAQELLKADGIDPANITEPERAVFRKMLESEQKRIKRLSWLSVGAVWMFAIVLLGLCVSENILEKLHIPFIVGFFVVVAAMWVFVIGYMRGHNRKVTESGRKVRRLEFLLDGRHRGFLLVGKKNGRRFIYWSRTIMITVGLWLLMSLGGAGTYYLLCQRWIYSEIPVFHIFMSTVISLSFVILILREGLKAPLKELIEVKPKPSKPIFRPDSWRLIMKSNITKIAAAAIVIIAALAGVYHFTGSIDGASVAWAGVVEKCHNFKTLTYTLKLSGNFSVRQNKDYDLMQTNYSFAFGKYKETHIAGSSRRGDYSIINERIIDENNQMTFIDHEAKTFSRRQLLPEFQKTDTTIVDIFKSLPAKADKVIGNKVINEQNTIGFLLKGNGINTELWINEKTHNPVLVEFFDDNSSKPSMVYSDFRFDADIDASQFDTHIPAGYSQIEPPVMITELKDASVDDFIYYLKLYATHSENGCFPDDINISRDKGGLFRSVGLRPIESAKCTESERKEMSVRGPKSYQFLGQMKPENDWHYAGKGVLMGQLDTPICWWKNKNSINNTDYTVIFADLSVETLKQEELPK